LDSLTTAYNIGLTLWWLKEYELIVPFAYRLWFGLNESRMAGTGKAEQQYDINCTNFTQ
jgi:hypothetical protein